MNGTNAGTRRQTGPRLLQSASLSFKAWIPFFISVPICAICGSNSFYGHTGHDRELALWGFDFRLLIARGHELKLSGRLSDQRRGGRLWMFWRRGGRNLRQSADGKCPAKGRCDEKKEDERVDFHVTQYLMM